MHLWDKEFGTNYAEEYNFHLAGKEMIVYGIADTSNIITP